MRSPESTHGRRSTSRVTGIVKPAGWTIARVVLARPRTAACASRRPRRGPRRCRREPASALVTSHARRRMIASSDWMSRSCDSARPIEISMSFSWRERSSSSSSVGRRHAQRDRLGARRAAAAAAATIEIGATSAVRSASRRQRVEPRLLELGVGADEDQAVVAGARADQVRLERGSASRQTSGHASTSSTRRRVRAWRERPRARSSRRPGGGRDSPTMRRSRATALTRSSGLAHHHRGYESISSAIALWARPAHAVRAPRSAPGRARRRRGSARRPADGARRPRR